MGSIKHFERITSKQTFDKVYKQAHKVWHTPYFVLFYRRDDCYEAAFVASKKLGKAVRRNRAKRLLRAHFIDELPILPKGRYIVVAKPPLVDNDYATVHRAFADAIKRCTGIQKKRS